ncbi:MAG TPA: YceI family protein [Povalibacter sp.]|nr:YceI family protein [Povalibacter sp.]
MPQFFRIAASFVLLLVLGLAWATSQWTMQPAQSSLGFTAIQADAPFEASFDKFTADIRFDPKDLATSHFDVRIDLASVNTKDGERDDILRSADLFDVRQWPTGHYVAEKFTDKGGGKFSATGQLTLRDVTRAVPIEFTFENANGTAWLKGSAALKRLDFGVGQGDWKDTKTVANEVQIRFALQLK